MEDILEKIRKYDKEDLLNKYKLDLWELVYLLSKIGDLTFRESIFSLKKMYFSKYKGKELKRWPSSDLDMNTAIEKKLKSLWYVEQNGNTIWLTNRWSEILKQINTKVNWCLRENFELYIKDHLIVSIIITAIVSSLITLIIEKIFG